MSELDLADDLRVALLDKYAWLGEGSAEQARFALSYLCGWVSADPDEVRRIITVETKARDGQ